MPALLSVTTARTSQPTAVSLSDLAVCCDTRRAFFARFWYARKNAAMQERIAYFQNLLAQFRKTATPEEFPAMASVYRAEIAVGVGGKEAKVYLWQLSSTKRADE